MDKMMDMRKDNDKCGIPNRHYKSFYKNYIMWDEWINDGRRDDSETVLRMMDNSEDIRPRMGDDNGHKEGWRQAQEWTIDEQWKDRENRIKGKNISDDG